MSAPRLRLTLGSAFLLLVSAVSAFAQPPNRIPRGDRCLHCDGHRAPSVRARAPHHVRALGPAGAPPLGAAGPPALGAAGPPPLGAAGPPPLGAAGSLTPDTLEPPSFVSDGDQ
jgi:hypothetical protein